MNPSQLAAFRNDLLRQREELFDLYRHDLRIGQAVTDQGAEDLVDRANNDYNRELMFALSNTEREAVVQIDEALERIDAGSFGECSHCGSTIGLARLKAVPWARYCIACQERVEMGLLDG